MSASPNAALNRLLRGISTDHVETVRQAWRNLLTAGHEATPIVRQKLSSDAWRKKPHGPSARYLGVLLALLHELDSNAFEEEIERLRGEPLHALHRRTIELMAKRHGDHVFGKIGDDIPVYISDEVDHPEKIYRYMQHWSRTPGLEMSNVTRVDVIAFHPEMDYFGRYNLLYDCIILTWQNEVPAGFARWWRKTKAELTFYHEVGHHLFQHDESGQVEEQEREADAYKRLMFRKAHPILIPILAVASSPILFVQKVSRYLSA